MLLYDVATASTALGATASRLAKRRVLVELLSRTPPADIEIVVAYLAGELRQRRTGVGWASLGTLPEPAQTPSLTVEEVDERFERMGRLAGPGSATARADAVRELFSRATPDEQRLLRGLVSGGLRQGALDAAMLDAVAAASGVPPTTVRRAAMLRGATGPVAVAALTEGAAAVEAFGLTVGQPVRPMLAASAADLTGALAKSGVPASLDVKLDGIRIQVHQAGDQVRVFTRSLDEITSRLPEVCAVARAFGRESLILDGEVMTLDPTGRPRPFQETASRTATQVGPAAAPPAEAGGVVAGGVVAGGVEAGGVDAGGVDAGGVDAGGVEAGGVEAGGVVAPFFFDILHVDGVDLIDLPLSERLLRLDDVVPADHRIARLSTDDPAAAEAFFSEAVASGQEGVVVKALRAPYDAGRRGSAWVKVKPRHTLDLVVLAVEWGSGRRQGWLSNIHLGARDPVGDGFVMLGKTFKGMTDAMLAWQTGRFLEFEESRSGHVVRLRPAQVVEIAFDGLQRSSRYPGGLALRFARVVRYRDDKTAGEADTIETVRGLAGPG